MRAKALAERAVRESDLAHTVLRALDRLRARRPVPDPAGAHRAAAGDADRPGCGARRLQPIWAEDVADCVMAALAGGPRRGHGARYELAGPETLTYDGDRARARWRSLATRGGRSCTSRTALVVRRR